MAETGTLKCFLKRFLKIIKDDTVLNTLFIMIDEWTQDEKHRLYNVQLTRCNAKEGWADSSGWVQR